VAKSSSVISVSIIGDAKKLITAVGQADTATGGLVKSGAKIVGTGIAVKKGFDLIGDSLQEADRRGDALDRLKDKLGPVFTDRLETTADNFHEIGASSQDILELEAIYADLATSAGVAAPDIAASAEAMAASAIAAGQVHDEDPTAIIDAMGKAAGGATRGLKPYGVDLTTAAVQQRAMKDTGKDLPGQLTDTELAAARTALIIEGFAGQLNAATTGSGDLEIKQDELGSKFEEVGGKAGNILAPALGVVLDFINDEIDAIPSAIDGWNLLGGEIVDFAKFVGTPLKVTADLINNILGAWNTLAGININNLPGGGGHGGGPGVTGRAPRNGGLSDAEIAAAQKRNRERNGLGN
jgi:hypothetical protein